MGRASSYGHQNLYVQPPTRADLRAQSMPPPPRLHPDDKNNLIRWAEVVARRDGSRVAGCRCTGEMAPEECGVIAAGQCRIIAVNL